MLAGVAFSGGVPANTLELLNTVRADTCHAATGKAPRPLVAAPLLAQAAYLLSQGQDLPQALRRAGYVAEEAAGFELDPKRSEVALRQELENEDCEELARPEATEVGLYSSASRIWVVVARPMILPRPEDVVQLRVELIDRINALRHHARHCGNRAFAAAPPLASSAILNVAAQEKSDEMAATGLFEHRNEKHQTLTNRIRDRHYPAQTLGENIGAGIASPAELVQGWVNSPGHCENLMDSHFNQAGVAFTINRDRESTIYWTLDLAEVR